MLGLGLLSACGSQQIKSSSSAVDPEYQLMASLAYLPVLESKDGKYLPYGAASNPYVTRGRIKKSSVAAFIEARKLFKSKQYESASKQLSALTKNDDSLSGPWVMQGDIKSAEGDLEAAEKIYEKALQTNKKNVNAWLRLAYTQRLQGQYLKAQNTYVNALAVWQDCPETHLNLAILYDLYLNLPIRAQKHMEAYVFLSDEKDVRVSVWLDELQGRTGVALSLPLEGEQLQSLVVAK